MYIYFFNNTIRPFIWMVLTRLRLKARLRGWRVNYQSSFYKANKVRRYINIWPYLDHFLDCPIFRSFLKCWKKAGKDDRAALLQDTARIKTEFQRESTFLFTWNLFMAIKMNLTLESCLQQKTEKNWQKTAKFSKAWASHFRSKLGLRSHVLGRFGRANIFMSLWFRALFTQRSV
jgi:hypothetical protein